jgi:hypothetical protein
MSASVHISGTYVAITSCNSDLTHCDFWAFPMLKHELRGQITRSDRQVTKAAVANV